MKEVFEKMLSELVSLFIRLRSQVRSWPVIM